MQPSVTCYYQPDKPKSRNVMEAFAAGCDGRLLPTTVARLDGDGPVAFYGVRPGWSHLWAQAKHEGRDWLYIDNSLFDAARERQFRVAKNRIQPTGIGESDGARLVALGVEIKPMRDDGENVIVASQSAEFMATVAQDPGWLDRITRNLRAVHGATRVIVRGKYDSRPLLTDLQDAGLLVTWSSAAAVTALCEGVRVLCAPECCATYVGTDRRKWASVLADNQWDLRELADGTAWKALNA